jgi:hypothetical protein
VDGAHFDVHEPTHPTMSKNPAYYSHKYNKAAVDYEIAISVYTQQVVWISGPYPAATHDITIYRNDLMAKIPPGKRVIADKGYIGEPETVSAPNSHDAPALRKFKGRARARQETFNARMKTFGCMATTFRNKLFRQKIAFEAVCVICQYQLENGSPLFDV